MKKISLILLAFLFVSLYSCDKDTQMNDVQTETISESARFLNSYYSETYSEGRYMNIDNNTMKLTEILGVNQEVPIGYTVVDFESQKLLYFMEVNVLKNEIKYYDINDNRENFKYSLENFMKDQSIKSIDKINFIDLIKNNNLQNSTQRMFGKSCGECSSGVGGGDFKTCCRHFLWVEYGCEQVGC